MTPRRLQRRRVAKHVRHAAAHLGAYAQLASVGERPATQGAEEELAHVAIRALMTQLALRDVSAPEGAKENKVMDQKDRTVSITLWAMKRVKQRVRAEQKHLTRAAGSQLLTDDECQQLGRPSGTALTDATEEELGRLANHHLDAMRDIQFWCRLCEQSSSSETRRITFAGERLDTLCCALGDQALEAAIAETHMKWERKFAEADEVERKLPPCLTCGTLRTLAAVSGLDDRICWACQNAVEVADLGPCKDCGGARELVGSAYTDGRCYDCADRHLAPCTQCGGKRTVGDSEWDGGSCWKCLEQQLSRCANCGRELHHLRIAHDCVSRTYTASLRQVAEAAGVHKATAFRAQKQLGITGWLLEIEGSRGRISSWQLPERSPVRTLFCSGGAGGSYE